jgi:hypothetical protein
VRYETRAGQVSEADTFSKMLEHLREAEECAYTLGHLNKTCGQDLKGQGFLAIGEMLKLTCINVTNLATRSMRSQSGFK